MGLGAGRRRFESESIIIFAPTSFAFFVSIPLPFALPASNAPISSNRLTCAKCSSFTHFHCASPPPPSSSSSTTNNTTSSSSTYLCPPCATPNFTFFDLNSDPNKAIDKRLALVLLCASKVASTSMTKAIIVARAEAERWIRENALAWKRAREALDHLSLLVHSRGDKVVSKDVTEVSTEASGLANLVHKHKENEKKKNGITVSDRNSGRKRE